MQRLQRGLYRQRCVWSRGAPQTLTGASPTPRPCHVRKGILLCGGGGLCHAGAPERGPSPQPLQPGVAHQSHPGIPAAAHHRLSQRLLPFEVGQTETLHSVPGDPNAAGSHPVPQRRCCRLR